ncbi:F-box protein At5g07610-like [Primulina eburnea]|uniref:F-box protein At5g07610-like n=1 Tax=Primulina eburnea TaxID=1245227 RepID=UPI003C6C324A
MKTKIKLSKTTDEAGSAHIVASIHDLLVEILLRLPIKSLIGFKLVSKKWHSLITNPEFCYLRNPDPNPAIGLFLPCSGFRTDESFEFVPFSNQKSRNSPFNKLNFTKDPSGIRILQSCNGLLLCCSSWARVRNLKYYVYNPTTKNFSTLPNLEPRTGISNQIRGMSLAFDPTKSPHYTVVCIRGFETDEYRYQIESYSSNTGPWRICSEPFTAEANFENGVYFNGAIHWINTGIGDSLYFDIENQALETMQMPPIPHGWDWRDNFYFGESCGHLYYMDIRGSNIGFDVYEMKKDHSEWFVKYQVDLAPVVAVYPGMIRDGYDPTDWCYYAFSIFSLVADEEGGNSFLVLQIPGKVLRFNLDSKTFEMLHEFEGAEVEDCLRFSGTNGFQYMESLCCV